MIKQHTFSVQGSSAEPYEISFQYDGSQLRAYCTCSAGENGMHCKHRLSILTGSTDRVVSDNHSAVMLVSSWLKGTELQQHLAEVEELEKQAAELKKQLTLAKKRLSKVMHGRLE